MSRFTIVVPRGPLRDAVIALLCLEPVRRSIDLWVREIRPDEKQEYPADIDNDPENWIYNISIQHDASATQADIDWLVGRLRTKWPYVRAEKEPSLWFEPIARNEIVCQPEP